jgi:hypothetical protein
LFVLASGAVGIVAERADHRRRHVDELAIEPLLERLVEIRRSRIGARPTST